MTLPDKSLTGRILISFLNFKYVYEIIKYIIRLAKNEAKIFEK